MFRVPSTAVSSATTSTFIAHADESPGLNISLPIKIPSWTGNPTWRGPWPGTSAWRWQMCSSYPLKRLNMNALQTRALIPMTPNKTKHTWDFRNVFKRKIARNEGIIKSVQYFPRVFLASFSSIFFRYFCRCVLVFLERREKVWNIGNQRFYTRDACLKKFSPGRKWRCRIWHDDFFCQSEVMPTYFLWHVWRQMEIN